MLALIKPVYRSVTRKLPKQAIDVPDSLLLARCCQKHLEKDTISYISRHWFDQSRPRIQGIAPAELRQSS